MSSISLFGAPVGVRGPLVSSMAALSSILFATLMAVTCTSGELQCIGPYFHKFGDACFAVSSGSQGFGVSDQTWQDASYICGNMSAQLLITNTQQQFDDAVSFMASGSGVRFTWIGCTSLSGANYTCEDNKAYYYAAAEFDGFWEWAANNPSPIYITKRCAYIYLDLAVMIENVCTIKNAFVCEKPAVEITSASPATMKTTALPTTYPGLFSPKGVTKAISDTVAVSTAAISTGAILTAASPTDEAPTDAGPTAAGPTVAGPMYEGTTAAGPTDADPMDTGPTDADPTYEGHVDADTTAAGTKAAGHTAAGPTAAISTAAIPTAASPTDEAPTDAGPTAAGPTVAGPIDAGTTAAGPTDADPTDTDPTDEGHMDAGATAAGTTAVGPTAAGPTAAISTAAIPTSAGPSAAGLTSSGPTVAGPTDEAPTDAGPTVVSPMDAGTTAAGPTGADTVDAGPTDLDPTDEDPIDTSFTDSSSTVTFATDVLVRCNAKRNQVQFPAHYETAPTKWHPQPGLCIHNHVITAGTVRNTVICATWCLDDPRCRSFNYVASEQRCEMSDVTMMEVEDGNLVSDASCIVFEPSPYAVKPGV
ncbi:mucin-19-like [Patiria miniata]|uniref:C-type lectin n=1 Tax=Patiria miniata TaxID=46514 RepID=A0A914BGJ9_PATMI|nr:mucin-19-like [Patiria miniata]